MTTLALTFRQHRFEFASLSLATLLVLVLAAWRASQLGGIDLPLTCLGDRPPGGPVCDSVGEFVAQADLGNSMLGLAAVAPFILGILLGVPVAASEIEGGWAQLTWSLDRRTGRWFQRQFVVHLAVVVVLTSMIAVAGHIIEGSHYPLWDPLNSFHDYASRGIPIVIRGAASYSIGVLAGAIIGRSLPSLIAAGFAALVVGIAVTVLTATWIPPAAIPELEVDGSYRISGLAYGTDGRTYSSDELATLSPHEFQSDAYWEWLGDNFTVMSLAVSPERYGEAVVGEAIVLLGGSASVAGSALLVVRRRRPTP